jgi:acyl carrier protein
VNKDDLAMALQEVFQETFDDSAIVISREMTASDLAEWDSFNHVRLIVAVEERFKINFSTSDIADLKNVGDLMDLIIAHCTDSGAGRS